MYEVHINLENPTAGHQKLRYIPICTLLFCTGIIVPRLSSPLVGKGEKSWKDAL